MTSLLKIASRVEAAIEAYGSLKLNSNLEEWRKRLDQEKIETARQFRLLKQNEGAAPALHPTLVALFIVLETGADLSQISRTHPKLKKHKFYDPKAKFPEDITDLLPPTGERWWETLAAEARQQVEASRAPLTIRIPPFKAPPPPPPTLPPPHRENESDVEMDEVDEELDQLAEDDYIPPSDVTRCSSASGPAAESATESKKRKGAVLLGPPAVKRHAGALQKEASADTSGDEFECDRCIKAGAVCKTDPLRPCHRCTEKKLRCSLMPHNDKTGKAVRRKMSAGEILAYRLQQRNMRKGKQPVRGPRDEASGSGASPSAMLSALELSSRSSYSPAEVSECAGVTAFRAPSRRSARGVEIPSAPFCVEVPTRSKKHRRSAAIITSPSTSPIPAAAPALTAADDELPAPADLTPFITAATTPAIAPAVAPPSTPSPAPDVTSGAAGITSLQATTALPASVPGSSPCIGSPSLAPALRKFLTPGFRRAHAPASPIHRQQIDAGATDGDLADRIQALERRMEEFDDWKRQDEEWKHQVEEKLRGLGF